MNPLRELLEQGQSVWLDYIRRGILTDGELERMVQEDGVRGVTSNPAIFEKAISGSRDYEDVIARLSSRCRNARELFEQVAVRDIRDAADILRPVYDESKGGDGFVSIEVSPKLARDTAGTVEEARRLWDAIGRPNVMIKVPATEEGIPAVEQLIGEGINVNVTLLFSQGLYALAAKAYMEGIRKRAAAGADISSVASVASFFVSRIDSAIDGRIEELIEGALESEKKSRLKGLLGKAAIANARQAYRIFGDLFGAGEWQALAAKGARPQRMLWASTGTKNPAYSDVLYVEELVGPDTVNTLPPATLAAFRDHGKVGETLTKDLHEADEVMAAIADAGVSVEEVTAQLLDDGVRSFAEAYEKLLAVVDQARQEAPRARISFMTHHLPDSIAGQVKETLGEWQRDEKVHRLWKGDASLWTGADESQWVGWLGLGSEGGAGEQLRRMAGDVRRKVRGTGITDALLMGMGGSSLCPEVLAETFGRQEGFPRLRILDSTDPAQVRRLEEKVDVGKTLFIVSSKSGTTLEPNIFMSYFLHRAKAALGPAEAGRRFIAITDPGSKLEEQAEIEGFLKVRHGLPSVGGRYSALTNFGMVPAAIMGIDLDRFLDRTEEMVEACQPCMPAAENPGVVLGAILGVAAKSGRDKVTLVASPAIYDLGAWLEQLIAESTGKEGKALIPVDLEEPGSPEEYGRDRIFIYLRLQGSVAVAQDRAMEALREAGQPTVTIEIGDVYDLGQEFFRWEIATAVAGAVMGINPFDQPDVEASKVETRKLTEEYEDRGTLPAEEPFLAEDGFRLFTNEENAEALKAAAGGDLSLPSCLSAHLGRLEAGDYFAILAYIEMKGTHRDLLQRIRHVVRKRKGTATCLGFGPRFLHSTGQAYKGGPNTGVFLQITCDDDEDLPVPGRQYTFGVVKAAQARGDFQVLADRKRRALRVHLPGDVTGGLEKLAGIIERAL